MKVFLAFCFFFGSILVVLALFVAVFCLHQLNIYLIGCGRISAGTFRYPEKIFPDLTEKPVQLAGNRGRS